MLMMAQGEEQDVCIDFAITNQEVLDCMLLWDNFDQQEARMHELCWQKTA
jgi:hypothetical protein